MLILVGSDNDVGRILEAAENADEWIRDALNRVKKIEFGIVQDPDFYEVEHIILKTRQEQLDKINKETR